MYFRWSLGVTAYELSSGRRPFESSPPPQHSTNSPQRSGVLNLLI